MAAAWTLSKPTQDGMVGKVAPAIEASIAGDKRFVLSEALKKGPVLVFFISTSCPVTDEASKYYERINKAFKQGTMTVLGIANDDKPGFEEWNKTHNLTFPVVYDSEYKHIEAYKVVSSPTSMLIAPDGKIAKVWVGYSEGWLKETVGVIASYLKVDPPEVDFKGAPKSKALG